VLVFKELDLKELAFKDHSTGARKERSTGGNMHTLKTTMHLANTHITDKDHSTGARKERSKGVHMHTLNRTMHLANTHITDNIVQNFRLRLILEQYSHALVANDLVALNHASAAKADCCLKNELVDSLSI
jgi:hypothetical protein